MTEEFYKLRNLVLKMVPNFAGHTWEQVAELSGIPAREKREGSPMSAGENAERIYRRFLRETREYVENMRKEAGLLQDTKHKKSLLVEADEFERIYFYGLAAKRSEMIKGPRKIDIDLGGFNP